MNNIEEIKPAPRTAQLWVWFDDQWRGVYLTEGGPDVTLHTGGKHDEGWSSETEIYTFEEGADHIECAVFTDGTDCDGRLSTEWHGVALLTELEAIVPPATDDGSVSPRIPKWSEAKSARRDYAAEAAGY